MSPLFVLLLAQYASTSSVSSAVLAVPAARQAHAFTTNIGGGRISKLVCLLIHLSSSRLAPPPVTNNNSSKMEFIRSPASYFFSQTTLGLKLSLGGRWKIVSVFYRLHFLHGGEETIVPFQI